MRRITEVDLPTVCTMAHMYVYESHELIQDNHKDMSLSNMEAWLFPVDSFFLVCISIPIAAALLHRKPSPTGTSRETCGAKDSDKRNSL